MPELTIDRMAKLYGLHRSTLYGAIEKGRVTAGRNSKNQRVIDLSEMIRVYGEPPGKTHPLPTPDTPTPGGYWELVEELRGFRRDEVTPSRAAQAIVQPSGGRDEQQTHR